MAKFIKSHSNYILRTQHQKTAEGSIFERDFMTISSLDGYSPDGIAVYGDNNFRFITREGKNVQKKHSRGSWVINNISNDENWKLSTLDTSVQTTESRIVLNKDYSSLKDFAYYGSAEELVKASVTDIVLRFPAELYFTDEEFTIGDKSYYLISNDFNIDVDSEYVNTSSYADSLRFLLPNLDKYALMGNGATENLCSCSYSISRKSNSCSEIEVGSITAELSLQFTDQTYTIYVYTEGDEKFLLYEKKPDWIGYRIRPQRKYIDEFWNSLDAFQRVILNRTSNPLYMAVFDTPKESDRGYVVSREVYVWPNRYGYNPDIRSFSYSQYLDKLIGLAKYHDEFDSDNIWRSMTHESIKNLDQSYVAAGGDFDNSRISAILKLYGRGYDDIKAYIDGIATINNISYDRKGNMPDYNLPDVLENAGFEVMVVNPTTDNGKITPVLYKGELSGYNASEVNVEFMRRLKLNANFLLSEKGTRQGVVDMLGLFGFSEDVDYSLKEYVQVAYPIDTPYPSISNVSITTLDGIKYPYYGYIKYLNQRKDNYDSTSKDALYGLPLKAVALTKSGMTATYVVPWFDKNKVYDEELYFQMSGGWGYSSTKTFNNSIAPEVKSLFSTAELSLFDEDLSSLKFAETIIGMTNLGSLLVGENDVCYVSDISNLGTSYMFKDGETGEDISHYFILKNKNYSSVAGYLESEATYGWKNIPLSEITGNTGDGSRVLYLEMIVDNTKGNAPHIGNNGYDRGQSYLDRMAMPFSKASFSTLSDTDAMKAPFFKFVLKEQEDNKKCWYFSNVEKTSKSELKNLDKSAGRYSISSNQPNIWIDYQTVNPEGGSESDEVAANSIINTKKLFIDFKVSREDGSMIDAMRNYIETVVLFYIKQMIPSTTILEYNIN